MKNCVTVVLAEPKNGKSYIKIKKNSPLNKFIIFHDQFIPLKFVVTVP
jgi:hypothetical protein